MEPCPGLLSFLCSFCGNWSKRFSKVVGVLLEPERPTAVMTEERGAAAKLGQDLTAEVI